MKPARYSRPRRAIAQLLSTTLHSRSAAWKRSMEIYDIIMLVVLIGAALFGAIKGFAWQLASIASILVSYFVAYRFREPFSQSIQADPPWNRFLAMLILYVGTALVVWVLFRMVSGTIDRMRLREFDRQIGFLFGLAKGGLYCVLITMFAVSLMGNQVRETIVKSRSGRYIAQVLDRSQAVIPPEIHEVVEPYLNRFGEQFHESNDDGFLQSMPWMASGQNRVAEPAPSQNWSSGFGQGVPRATSPQQWAPAQQAQQPQRWNGFQR